MAQLPSLPHNLLRFALTTCRDDPSVFKRALRLDALTKESQDLEMEMDY